MHCVRAVAWRPQSYSTSLSAPPPASHSSHGRLASRPHWSERVRVLKTPYSLSLCRAEPSQALSESLRRNQTQTLIFFFLSIKTKAKRVVSRPVSTPPPTPDLSKHGNVALPLSAVRCGSGQGKPAALHPPKAWVLDPSSSHQVRPTATACIPHITGL